MNVLLRSLKRCAHGSNGVGLRVSTMSVMVLDASTPERKNPELSRLIRHLGRPIEPAPPFAASGILASRASRRRPRIWFGILVSLFCLLAVGVSAGKFRVIDQTVFSHAQAATTDGV